MIELKDLPPEVLLAAGADGVAAARAPVGVVLRPMEVSDVSEWTATEKGMREAPEDDAPLGSAVLPAPSGADQPNSWEAGLQAEALALLEDGRTDVWDVLTRRFETRLIQTALLNTRGRRIEAAQKLGIGRNTITRKIQELHLD
jgi:two-component system nitrogen regulation response regulator GlnG